MQQDDDLKLYEPLDLKLPIIPPRSPLYCLKPRGVGTPYVESQTSYFNRLVNEHKVSVRTLAIHKISPFLESQCQENSVCNIFLNKNCTLNGTSFQAARIASVLEQLTLRPDLHCLTMVSWSNLLSHVGLSRLSRAWCPACYAEWKRTSETLYDPLLWTLKPITVCPRHQQRLSFHCPQPDCQATLPWITSDGRIGFCPKCDCWLGEFPTETKANEQPLGEDELVQASLKADILGQLLIIATHLTEPPSKEGFAKFMSVYVADRSGGNVTALARQVEISRDRLRSCMIKTGRLQVDHFIEICHRLAIAPSDIFTEQENLTNHEQALKISQWAIGEVSERRDLDRLSGILETILVSKEDPPPSMEAVALQLRCDSDYLRNYFPAQCDAIVERHQKYWAAERLRWRQELEMVLTSEGKWPFIEEIARRLGITSQALRFHFPDLCEAIVKHHRNCQEAEWLRWKQKLERVAISNDEPLSLKEVAHWLGTNSTILRYHFPALCMSIVERYRKSKTTKQSELRQEFEVFLASDELPPPLLKEVAQRLGCQVNYLQYHFPDLCAALVKLRREQVTARAKSFSERKEVLSMTEIERAELLQELEAVLKWDGEPPSLEEVARQLGCKSPHLYREFPDLCKAIVNRRKDFMEAERLKWRLGLEAVLNAGEEPPPSLSEVGFRLGCSTTPLYRYFPDLCAVIVRHYQEFRKTKRAKSDSSWGPGEDRISSDLKQQRLRKELETILASNEEPPLSLSDVTRRLECPVSFLCYHFPVLCDVVVERHRRYSETERLKRRLELEAILVSSEEPLPSLLAIARRLETTETRLRSNFPDLCEMIIDRRRKYREAELVRWRQQLEALLADEREIPSLNEVAGRLNCSTESLRHHFPDLCKTLVKHRLHDEEIERTKLRQKVEAILASEEEPPSSLSEVARRLGCRLMHLYIFPDLASKIVARYTTFKNQRAQQVMKQLCKEVREITFQIYLEENCYPSRNLVYSRFSKPGYFRNQKIRSAYHQALRDLGLLK